MPIPLIDGQPVADWPGEVESVGGRSLFVRRPPAPAGAPLAVFVHGLGGASTNWTDLMYLLRDEVVGSAPDLPGFGFSDPPADDNYALDTHVDAVTAFVEAQGGPVHLFGNSLGGAVAARVTARRPDLVATLTLVSAALPDLRPRRGTDSRMGLFLIPGLAQLISTWVARQPAETRARAVAELCFADPASAPRARLDQAVAELERRRDLAWSEDALIKSLRGLIGAQLRFGRHSLWREVASIRVPTLVVGGRHDKLVHYSVAQRAARTIAGARLLLLENCGHVAQMEQPDAVARAWRSFVATPAPLA